MRALLPLARKKRKKNSIGNLISSRSRFACCGKKGLSNMVGYVLLISISLALSVMVYSWLRFYVAEEDIDTCSDNVNIIIRSYECYKPYNGSGGRINVTLKNKGLFTVDGYELRVHDRAGANFGIYLFDDNGTVIEPGEEYTENYLFVDNKQDTTGNNEKDYELETVTFVEVQPFVLENGSSGEVRCKSHASQEVICG